MKKIYYIILAVAFLLGFTQPCLAGEPTDQIKSSVDKLVEIVQSDKSDAEKDSLLWEAADERFHWEEMTHRCLARNWKNLTDEEKAEIIGLFKKLIFKTYIAQIKGYSGEKIEYLKETISKSESGNKYALVKTEIKYKGQDTALDYRMKLEEDQWMIYDVSILGISMVRNYRSQFNSIIKGKKGYKGLVESLKKKVGDTAKKKKKAEVKEETAKEEKPAKETVKAEDKKPAKAEKEATVVEKDDVVEKETTTEE